MANPDEKRKCPYCGRLFKGLAPDGESFYDKHELECFERTPPDARSAPIAMALVPCACGNEKFEWRAHYDRFRRMPSLWEYGCTKCGAIQTVQTERVRK